MKISGIGRAGSDCAWVTIHVLTPVTRSPPREANAWVEPSTHSLWRLSGNTSASQVMAATNSTQTPINVVHRKKMNVPRLVLYAAAKGESA